MAQPAAEEDELWEVSLAPGERKVMTLEQLDDAYRLGIITEATLVCERGSEDWQPLYVVAGLDPPESFDEPTTQFNIAEVAAAAAAQSVPHAAAPVTASKAKATVMGLGPGGYGASPGAAPPPQTISVRPPPLPANAFGPPAASAGASPIPLSVPSPSDRRSRPGRGAKPMAAPRPRTSPSPVVEPPKPLGPPRPRRGTPRSPQPTSSAVPRALPRFDAVPPLSTVPEPSAASAAPAALPRIAPVPNPTGDFAPAASATPPPVPRIAGFPAASLSAPPPVVPPIAPALPVQIEAPPQQVIAAAPAPHAPPVPARGMAPTEFWILGVALFLGLFVTAQRHGVLASLASSVGAEGAYASFEKAVFNGPSLNTPRGVKQLLDEQRAADLAAEKEALNR